MGCTLFFTVPHLLLLLLFLFVHDCQCCCPLTLYSDCHPHEVQADNKGDGGFGCSRSEHICKSDDCQPNEAIVLTNPDDGELVFVCNDSPIIPVWNLPCSNNTFMWCDQDGHDSTDFLHCGPKDCPADHFGCIACQNFSSPFNFSSPGNDPLPRRFWVDAHYCPREGGGDCPAAAPRPEEPYWEATQGPSGSPRKRLKRVLIIFYSVLAAVILVLLLLLALYWRRRHNNQGFKTSSSGIRCLSRTRSDYPETNGVTVFSYAELQEATNNFDETKELGEGGFGVVYHGKLRDGREVAVKRMYEKNYTQIEQFKNEIRILTTLRHPNLVTLYGCGSRHSRELLLVYDYIPNKTVAEHLHGDKASSALLLWPARMSIAVQTATALSYLHFNEVIHRDIKTDNILLDHGFRAKVADFGLSRLFPADVSHVSTAPQGTPGYVDPEYHQCYHLTDRSDVYSFGVVLVELVSSLPAVDLGRHRHEVNLAHYAMNRIQCSRFGELVDPRLGFDREFKVRRMTTLVAELAFRCLQEERELRPSMTEVLEELQRLESADYDALEEEETQ